MSAPDTPQAPGFLALAPAALRFGRESQTDGGAVEWHLRRNCSISPRQLILFYLSLCGVSLGIASLFWWGGAPFVMPFAGLELLAVGAALLVYARHATDRESLLLQPGVLTVERTVGPRTLAVELSADWVRVEPAHGDRSLIELSDRGRKVEVGRFVRPELRRALADELRWSLRRRQHGSRGAA